MASQELSDYYRRIVDILRAKFPDDWPCLELEVSTTSAFNLARWYPPFSGPYPGDPDFIPRDELFRVHVEETPPGYFEVIAPPAISGVVKSTFEDMVVLVARMCLAGPVRRARLEWPETPQDPVRGIDEMKGFARFKKPVGVRSLTLQAMGLRLRPMQFGFTRQAPAMKGTLGWLYEISEEQLQEMLPVLYAGEGLDRTEWVETIARAKDGRIAYFAHAKNDAPWAPIQSEAELPRQPSLLADVGYRHYKGGLYRGICVSTDEGTGAKYVVYSSVATGKVWHRPIDDFFGTVPGPDGPQPRFREEQE